MVDDRAAVLHHRESGVGPAVLLLHGLGGDHTVWNEVLPVLAARHRVLAPDLRGHGRSPAPEGSSYGFETLEADLFALLDRSEIAKAHWVGLSAGGCLALRAVLDHPERAASLTMIGSGSYCDRHTRSVALRWAETYRTDGVDGLALRLLKDLYYPDWIESHMEFVDSARALLRRGTAGAAVRWGEVLSTFDERARIPKLKVPLLAIHGMDDQVVDVTHARLLRQSVQGTEVRLLAKTGHLVPIERPAETAEAIGRFVQRVESGVAVAGPS